MNGQVHGFATRPGLILRTLEVHWVGIELKLCVSRSRVFCLSGNFNVSEPQFGEGRGGSRG